MEGLSAKSVVVSFICQLIVFLYLLDNETSWMILASAGVGCCIEFWKIGKAMHIEVCTWFIFWPFFTLALLLQYTWCIFLCRLIIVGVSLSSDFGIEILMQATKPKNMMIWQWNTCLICCFCWLYAPPSTHLCMNAIRAGTRGYCPPAQVVCTLLVSSSCTRNFKVSYLGWCEVVITVCGCRLYYDVSTAFYQL